MKWVIPIFRTQTPRDEALAAQCAALAMIRYGTTCFMEAGTVTHLDATMEALAETGIRGRVGEWVEGRYGPNAEAEAISTLRSEVERYPDKGGEALLAAWPVMVGHSTNTDAVWQSIVEQEGSVQHLDCLTEDEKAVFRTAFEIDQRWIIELAADRTPYICQSQSLNLFLPADVDKWDLHMLHWTAWERGIKSLYYCRSKSISRAGFAGQLEKKGKASASMAPKTDYEECLACQ